MNWKGASSGIGAATAALFSKLGASVVLMGRNEKGLDDTMGQCETTASNKVKFKNSISLETWNYKADLKS